MGDFLKSQGILMPTKTGKNTVTKDTFVKTTRALSWECLWPRPLTKPKKATCSMLAGPAMAGGSKCFCTETRQTKCMPLEPRLKSLKLRRLPGTAAFCKWISGNSIAVALPVGWGHAGLKHGEPHSRCYAVENALSFVSLTMKVALVLQLFMLQSGDHGLLGVSNPSCIAG